MERTAHITAQARVSLALSVASLAGWAGRCGCLPLQCDNHMLAVLAIFLVFL